MAMGKPSWWDVSTSTLRLSNVNVGAHSSVWSLHWSAHTFTRSAPRSTCNCTQPFNSSFNSSAVSESGYL